MMTYPQTGAHMMLTSAAQLGSVSRLAALWLF